MSANVASIIATDTQFALYNIPYIHDMRYVQSRHQVRRLMRACVAGDALASCCIDTVTYQIWVPSSTVRESQHFVLSGVGWKTCKVIAKIATISF